MNGKPSAQILSAYISNVSFQVDATASFEPSYLKSFSYEAAGRKDIEN
jgi:hypothetical protein